MDDRFDEVVWSPKSQQDLDNILEYYQEFNKDTANSKVVNIITKTEEMVFSKQYQIDEFDSTCRRLFVEKKFRVLYKLIDGVVLITRVYPTRKDPEGISTKK